jgi:hypothetical protein
MISSSFGSYSWISPLLKRSHKQNALHGTDLYDLLPHLESSTLTERLEKNWFDEIERSKQQRRCPSLIRATLRTMGWSPLLIGLLLIPNVTKFHFTLMRHIVY